MASIESLKATVRKLFWCPKWAPLRRGMPAISLSGRGDDGRPAGLGDAVPPASSGSRRSRNEAGKAALPGDRLRLFRPVGGREDDLRQESRYGARLPVFFGLAPDQVWPGFSANLSSGGILIETHHPLPIDSTVNLIILFRGEAGSFRCRGRVVWRGASCPAGEGRAAEMGVQFVELTAQQRGLLRSFIEEEGLFPVP